MNEGTSVAHWLQQRSPEDTSAVNCIWLQITDTQRHIQTQVDKCQPTIITAIHQLHSQSVHTDWLMTITTSNVTAVTAVQSTSYGLALHAKYIFASSF